jgi:hypothetical protein
LNPTKCPCIGKSCNECNEFGCIEPKPNPIPIKPDCSKYPEKCPCRDKPCHTCNKYGCIPDDIYCKINPDKCACKDKPCSECNGPLCKHFCDINPEKCPCKDKPCDECNGEKCKPNDCQKDIIKLCRNIIYIILILKQIV